MTPATASSCTPPAGDTLWNWQHVLAAFLAGPAPGSPSTPPGKERLVEVRGLTPHGGYISIRQPGYDVRFFGTNAVLSRVTLSAPHLAAPVVEVAQARATLERPDRGWRLPFTAALHRPGGRVQPRRRKLLRWSEARN